MASSLLRAVLLSSSLAASPGAADDRAPGGPPAFSVSSGAVSVRVFVRGTPAGATCARRDQLLREGVSAGLDADGPADLTMVWTIDDSGRASMSSVSVAAYRDGLEIGRARSSARLGSAPDSAFVGVLSRLTRQALAQGRR